jgi:hypothetical protein
MITDNLILSLSLSSAVPLIFKLGFILFGVLYFIFSLIAIRQVTIMADTVRTEGGSILKALAIFHAGLALGIVILFIGLF